MDKERLEELFDKYMDRVLSPAEEAELANLLGRPECQAHWRTLASLEGKIQEELLQVRAEDAPSKRTRRSLRPSTRRTFIPRGRPPWLAGLVAAGLFVAVLLFIALGSSEPDPAVHSARAAREAERRRLETEQKRREAVERLREIERKRQELTTRPPEPAQNPDVRKKALEQLQNDRERIERELREAVQLAPKPAPPPAPPQEEKPA